MEKIGGFNKIIGGNEQEKEDVRNRAVESMGKTPEGALEPTPEEVEVIEKSYAYVLDIASQYGVEFSFPKERIYIFSRGAISERRDGKISGGVYNSFSQAIGIERGYGLSAMSRTLAHELFHSAGYHAVQILKDGDDSSYRSGVMMRSRKDDFDYFDQADEAIVSRLADGFYQDVMVHDGAYYDDVERTNIFKDWIADYLDSADEGEVGALLLKHIGEMRPVHIDDRVIEVIENDDRDNVGKFNYLLGYLHNEFESGILFHERHDERKKFEEVLRYIELQTNGVLDQEMIEGDFIKVHFTGNYIPLARKIEKQLGKGSFRKIAERLGSVHIKKEVSRWVKIRRAIANRVRRFRFIN
jgi:hypothetical protein